MIFVYFFYSLERIQSMPIFSMFDFSTFNDFQNIAILLGVNIFNLLFMGFSITILYKSVNRIINFFF